MIFRYTHTLHHNIYIIIIENATKKVTARPRMIDTWMDGSRMINEAKSGRGIAHLFVICIAASFANLKYCPYHTRQDIRQWPRLNSDHDFLWWLYPSHPPPHPHQLWLFDNSSLFCTPVKENPLSSSLGIFSICLIGTYGNDRRPLVAKVDQLVAPEPVCRTISTTCILCVNTNMFVALLIREGVKNGKILDLLLNLHALLYFTIQAAEKYSAAMY